MTLIEFQESARNRGAREVVRFNRTLTEHYREARRQIQNQLDRLYARVLAGVDTEDYYAVAVRFDRLSKLQGAVREAMLEAARKAGVTIRESSQLSMANVFYENQYALSTAGNTVGVRLAFRPLPETVVQLAVSGAADRYKAISAAVQERFGSRDNYQPKYGTLSEILSSRRAQDLQRVQSAITQGLIQGRNPRVMAREVNRAIGIGRNNAERILRTESHRLRELGNYAATQNARAEGLDARRQIVSVLDDRTRPQSVQVDGVIESEDGTFRYPGGVRVVTPGNSGNPAWDIFDRETVITLIPGLEPETRTFRDPVTQQNGTMTYANFTTWAQSVGLERNRYGQWVAG